MHPVWIRVYQDLDPFLDQHNMTRTRFAEYCGISLSTITRAKSNPKHVFCPSVGTLRKIYAGMGRLVPTDILGMQPFAPPLPTRDLAVDNGALNVFRFEIRLPKGAQLVPIVRD